ncbi:MAG: ABC transporter ATP-binding protein/permease, partial [Chloroflexota bacterium]|nr:ABC transporter ATP-binding protein/permease [Chloroflexota bacterium]
FLLVALLTQVAAVFETRVAEDLGWRTTNALRADLTRHVLGLDGQFHADHSPGELIERIDGDISAIADFFARFVVQVLGSCVFLVGVLILLFGVDWRIGVVLTAFVLVALAFMLRSGGFVAHRAGAARQAAADLSGYVEETLAGLSDLKTSGADAYVMGRLHERLAAQFHRFNSAAMAGSIFNGGVGVIFALGTGAALVFCAALHGSGAMTLGAVYVVFRYTSMLRLPLERLTTQMNSLQQAAGGIVRVRELFNARAEVTDGPGLALPEGAMSVELEAVSFAYEALPILHDVSFRVEPGQVLGLLGRTGSGKTTISRLLFRLHDPTHGTIRLGGTDIREVRLEDLRERVGLVTQDIQLFQGTLRDNVALFDAGVTDEVLREVFELLELTDWLESLGAGLDTLMGPGGRGVSAGEAQLIALARVFLKDPGLVILDEAYSRIDPATERLLERAVSHLLERRTGVIIAHRLTIVERADSIAILETGRVVECGRRVDLAHDPNSRFARLLRTGAVEALA